MSDVQDNRPSPAMIRVRQILEAGEPRDRASEAFDTFILTLIILNVAAIAAETISPVYRSAPAFFRWFEIFSVAVFTVEYVLRVWSAPAEVRYRSPVWGRLRFAVTPMALVDLLAILPFYLPFLGVDLRFIRAFRLVRLLRIGKLTRYTGALYTLGRVILARKEELLTVAFILFLLLVVTSSLMYFAEHTAQPEAFSSIPKAMWWGVTMLTSTDIDGAIPVTPLGRALAVVIAFFGVGLFALPTGILGAAFTEEIARQEREASPEKCPRCGQVLKPPEP
ncbi:MAG: ion transporter [Candidatus Zixiibacteriota bacterium]|nr:MAG: ion transporter [candidate division Zixibacteria bacterium]